MGVLELICSGCVSDLEGTNAFVFCELCLCLHSPLTEIVIVHSLWTSAFTKFYAHTHTHTQWECSISTRYIVKKKQTHTQTHLIWKKHLYLSVIMTCFWFEPRPFTCLKILAVQWTVNHCLVLIFVLSVKGQRNHVLKGEI